MTKEREQQLQDFCTEVGIKIENLQYLDTALTHRSYINENKEVKSEHNERIEFLGDAVLELIVSEYLFKSYSDRPEGELTSFRAASVKTETLAEIARGLNYGKYLRMSKGEEATGGKDKDYLLANTFEAVLGALYLDRGFTECQAFISRVLLPHTAEIVENRLDIDAKTRFQEIAQSFYKITPNYRVLKEEGPDHEKIFTMGAYIGERLVGTGTGASKQKAEEDAALKALKTIEKEEKLA